MATTLYLADAPTYAALIAAYPEKGAALLALPSGTRCYVEDMGCEVRRSSGGKFWIPGKQITGPTFLGSGAHWVGPANTNTLSSSAAQGRKTIRPVYFRMPGFRAGTIARISIYQATAGTAGAGTDSCALRLYAAAPDGSPIENQAPLYVWDWNAAGSGGAGTLSLVSAGANATRLHADLPGGAVEVPAHFWLGFIHDLASAPALSTISAVAMWSDAAPSELSGTDTPNTLNLTKSPGYSWTEATAWSIGNTAVWPASTDYVAGGAASVVPHLKVTA